MPHDIRIRIFAGISLTIAGFLFAAFAPAAIAFAWMPDFNPTTLENELPSGMARLLDIADWGMRTAIAGWTIAAAAFGYTYYVWARWFLGNKPQAARVDA
jgi:hypothetical protein